MHTGTHTDIHRYIDIVPHVGFFHIEYMRGIYSTHRHIWTQRVKLAIFGTYFCLKKVFIVYLKSNFLKKKPNFNWTSYILFGKPVGDERREK